MNTFEQHYEETLLISATPSEVFNFADYHKNFSSHMNKSSWMMGGGKMDISMDKDMGKKVGSLIRLSGTAFGLKIYLEEVITKHKFPSEKAWKTVSEPRLLIIGQYCMALKIKPMKNESILTVSIDYSLPAENKWLGIIFSRIYAKWCVRQMIKSVENHFLERSR